MERESNSKITIDKEGWRKIEVSDSLIFPNEVQDCVAFLDREKMLMFVNNNPYRMYRYYVDGQEYTIDCKSSKYILNKQMRGKGALQEDIDAASDISDQLRYFYGKISALSRLAFGGWGHYTNGILTSKAEDLLDLFGRLHSTEEVCRIVNEDWGFSISKGVISKFYQRNLKEIEKLRDQYATDFSDVALTKKRSRLDKLSIMFYTYFNKWQNDNRLEYSRELRSLIEQIRKEVEGEQLNINIQGQINVDMTIEANKTLTDVYKRVPVNNMILALVAAKKNMDPTKLMTQLTSSYYAALTGYGAYNPEVQLVHPVDLTYNWNEIQRKHRGKESLVIEEAKLVTSSGDQDKDAQLLTTKKKLLQILEGDKAENDKRRK